MINQEGPTLWKTSCLHCRKLFLARLPDGPPQGDRWWYLKIFPLYCNECGLLQEQALEAAHRKELQRALEAGELMATRYDQRVSAGVLAELVRGTGDFLTRLSDADIIITPPDWWHDHLAGTVIQLSQNQDWSLNKTGSILFQILPDGRLSRWSEPSEKLPPAALPQLLECGAMRHLCAALRRPGGHHSRDLRHLCSLARDRLNNPEPQVRFEALLVLIWVDLAIILADLMEIASDREEHPRVRGLALEGLSESLDCSNPREPWVRRTLRRVEGLLLDPEPEVRWWACFVASHVSRGRWVDLYRRPRVVKWSYNRRLVEKLEHLVNDQTPAGLGWSVGKEAKDAIAHLEEGRELPYRPMCSPYDPWGSL